MSNGLYKPLDYKPLYYNKRDLLNTGSSFFHVKRFKAQSELVLPIAQLARIAQLAQLVSSAQLS